MALPCRTNHCIQRFVEWDRYSDAVQMISLFPNMMDAVLQNVDEETIEKMAERIVETSCFKDVSLLIFKAIQSVGLPQDGLPD